MDLFSFDQRESLIIVHFLTNYLEIYYLNEGSTSLMVIRKINTQFARHGIPIMVYTDNGPQFTSQEFQSFAQSWGFTHKTSSPMHSQSDGKAESAVKTAKQIMQRAKSASTDAWKAFLEYRYTPSQGLVSSRSERCFFFRDEHVELFRYTLNVLDPSEQIYKQWSKRSKKSKKVYLTKPHMICHRWKQVTSYESNRPVIKRMRLGVRQWQRGR